MFTGDRSGDFLFAALHRAGYANQALSRSLDDGLELSGAWVTAAVRCAPPDNKPTPRGAGDVRRLPRRPSCGVLTGAASLLALGAFAYEALLAAAGGGRGACGRNGSVSLMGSSCHSRPSSAGRRATGVAGAGRARTLLCSYHPSQRNVFTGLLTAEMFDEVLARARELGA